MAYLCGSIPAVTMNLARKLQWTKPSTTPLESSSDENGIFFEFPLQDFSAYYHGIIIPGQEYVSRWQVSLGRVFGKSLNLVIG